MSSSRYRNRPAALVACSSSRRRRKVADAAATTRDSSSWASLHEDLVSLIGWRVLAGDLRDYIRFRAVCPHWRSSTTCPRGRGIVDPHFHPRRWMLFPEGHGLHPGHGKLRGHVRFFNLSTGAFVRVHLPLFRDHCVLDSIDGVLLLQRDHDTAVRLLHPFTGDIAEFPPLETLVPYVSPWQLGDKRDNVRNIGAASISVGADGAVRVVMSLPGIRSLCFATSGDQQWRVPSWWWHEKFSVPLPFQGKLYLVHQPEVFGEPEVLQVDPPQQQGDMDIGLPPPKLIAKCPPSTESAYFSYFLVECNSEILVITIHAGEDMQYSFYRLADLIVGRTVPLTCINGNTIFFCVRRSLWVSSKAFPTVVADTIVVYDFDKCNDSLAQYHLNTGTSSAASDGRTEGLGVPSPCSIICHIFTCCLRDCWNKGQIMGQGGFKPWRVKRKWRNGC